MKLPCAISPCCAPMLVGNGWDAFSRSSGTKWHKSPLGLPEKSGIHPHLLIERTDVLRRMSKVSDFCLTAGMAGTRTQTGIGWLAFHIDLGHAMVFASALAIQCEFQGEGLWAPQIHQHTHIHPPGRRVSWARSSPSHRHGTLTFCVSIPVVK